MSGMIPYSKKREGSNYKNKGVYAQIKIKSPVDIVAVEDLKQFNDKMEELFQKMPRGVERRCSLKKMEMTAIGKTFSAYEKDKAQTLLKFTRKYCYNAWFGVDPLMHEEKYVECIKRILLGERIVTVEFFNNFHGVAQYSISRHWTDFKYNQLKHMFAPFKHGGSFRFLRGALEGFNISFDPINTKDLGLDSEESIEKQKSQPCTLACYKDIKSEGKESGSVFSVSSFASDGNPLLDESENARGGWLLLTLDYIYEAFKSMNLIFQEIGSLSKQVLPHHVEMYNAATSIASFANPVIVFEEYADNYNSSFIEVVRQIRSNLAGIRSCLGQESDYKVRLNSASTNDSHAFMTQINNKHLEATDLLRVLLLKMEKSPLHILFYMLRCHDGKYHVNPFYRKRKASGGQSEENAMTYIKMKKLFSFKFFGMVYKLVSEFFFHRPIQFSITADVLELVGKKNICKDKKESQACLELLQALAETHFDNAFGDENDVVKCQYRFRMFRDFWKSYHADVDVTEGPTPSQEDVFADDTNFEEDRDNDNDESCDKGPRFKKTRSKYGLSFDSSDEE